MYKIPLSSLPTSINSIPYKETYSKEYIQELKNIHEKEKGELMFKINSLQNSISRIKMSYQEQIKNMKNNSFKEDQDASRRIETLETNYEEKIIKLEESKNAEIDLLKTQIENQKLINDKILNDIEKLKNEYKILENTSIKRAQNSNEKIQKIEKEYKETQEESQKKLENIEKIYNDDITKIKNENSEKLNSLNSYYKIQFDTMNKEFSNKVNEIVNSLNEEINTLKNDKVLLQKKLDLNDENYNERIKNIKLDILNKEKEIDGKKSETNSLAVKLKEAEDSLNKIQNENDENLDCIKKLNERINLRNEESINLNNLLKSLRFTNEQLNNKIYKITEDYKKICNHADSLSIEYTNKIKSLGFIEDRNQLLERENIQLRNKINVFMEPQNNVSYKYINI